MFDREDFDTAPLTPFQRPIVAASYIGVAFLVLIFAIVLLWNIESVSNYFRHKPVSPNEIGLATITTSSTANDRLVAVYLLMQQLDDDARKYFGELHKWHDPDKEPAPMVINIFNHSLNDPENRFLQMYNDIAEARMRNQKLQDQLAAEVDGTVSDLGPQTTADFGFRSQRLLAIEIDACLKDLARQIKNLNDLGKEYQEGNK